MIGWQASGVNSSRSQSFLPGEQQVEQVGDGMGGTASRRPHPAGFGDFLDRPVDGLVGIQLRVFLRFSLSISKIRDRYPLLTFGHGVFQSPGRGKLFRIASCNSSAGRVASIIQGAAKRTMAIRWS